MSEFIKDLSTLHFWLAVIVVGLMLEIGGHLLAKSVDKLLSRSSSWWKSRSQAKTVERQKNIEKLQANTKEQIIYLMYLAVMLVLGFFALTASLILFSVVAGHTILKGAVAPPDSIAANFLLSINFAGAFFLLFAIAALRTFFRDAYILVDALRQFNSTNNSLSDKT